MLFNEIHLYLLMMLESTSQYLELAHIIKSEIIKDSEISEEEAKEINSVDVQTIVFWRESVIHKIKVNTPPAFQDVVDYETWDEMIKYLDKYTEKKNYER